MGYRLRSVTVDISLDEFDDDDLVDELTERGFVVTKALEPTSARELFDRYVAGDPRVMHELLQAMAEQAGRIL